MDRATRLAAAAVTAIAVVALAGWLAGVRSLDAVGARHLPSAMLMTIALALGLSIAVPAVLRHHAAKRERDRERAHSDLVRQGLVFEMIGDAVLVMDLNGHILDWNPAASRLFGYTKAEIVGRPVVTGHDPSLEGRLEAAIRASLRREQRWAGELPFQRKDGTRRMADILVVAQLDQNGQPAAWIGVNRDITGRRRAEAALADSHTLLAAAGELAHVGSWRSTSRPASSRG